MKEDTYAIQCFLNGERKLTNELEVAEARNFYAAAQHLSKYLKENYLIPSEEIYNGELWDADPHCKHVLNENCMSGIKCKYCRGWMCL